MSRVCSKLLSLFFLSFDTFPIFDLYNFFSPGNGSQVVLLGTKVMADFTAQYDIVRFDGNKSAKKEGGRKATVQ